MIETRRAYQLKSFSKPLEIPWRDVNKINIANLQ